MADARRARTVPTRCRRKHPLGSEWPGSHKDRTLFRLPLADDPPAAGQGSVDVAAPVEAAGWEPDKIGPGSRLTGAGSIRSSRRGRRIALIFMDSTVLSFRRGEDPWWSHWYKYGEVLKISHPASSPSRSRGSLLRGFGLRQQVVPCGILAPGGEGRVVDARTGRGQGRTQVPGHLAGAVTVSDRWPPGPKPPRHGRLRLVASHR